MDVNPQPTPSVPERDAAGSRATERLRNACLVSLVALLIEYGLGIGLNLFVNVPSADQGASVPAAVGKAMSNGPAALAAHAGIGLILVVGMTAVLIRSLRARPRLLAASSAVAWLCVLGAAGSGARFVGNGANSASMTMAVLTGVAIACYAINLYLLSGRRA